MAQKRVQMALRNIIHNVTTHSADPWLVWHRPNPSARIRLFCFPYAGGGAHVFQRWHKGLPSSIEVCAIQPPGRGARLLEPPFTECISMVRAVSKVLLAHLKEPFAFFGHSMGALIGFETARALRAEHGLTPAHIFVSGSGDPQRRARKAALSELSEPEFIAELNRYGGMPEEALNNIELIKMMMPTLRADFKVCESYVYSPQAPLECPFSAFGGLQDVEVTRERLESWRAETASSFSMRMFPGGHFYLHTQEHLLFQAIARDLRQFL